MTKLLPQHVALIRASAISDEVALARRYESVEQKARLKERGFSDTQARVPALLIPLWDVHGGLALYQTRADQPRILNGRAVKYEAPARSRMVLDVPPTVRGKLGDPAVPLFVTEGVRKADAAASIGLCCIDVIGVWAWRGTNEDGGTTALTDWESIALNDRVVYIVFDSDVMTKPSVHQALVRLKAFLDSRRAQVHLIYLPSAPDGAKVGLDDYLAAGHGRDELLALATSELRSPPGVERDDSPYRETAAGLVMDKPTANGPVTVSLTNFRARIVAQVVEDDGAEQRRLFELEGALGERSRTFRTPAIAFGAMNWPTEQLGAGAVTYAGMGMRDHARVAIQLLSGQVPERTLYTHIGWREVDGTWVYLHGAGAIGPEGPVSRGIETRLDGALARYLLPVPPEGDELRDAVRASLGLLDVAPDPISVPLLAAVYRVALGGIDHSVHLTGPSGTFKTELAALVQQHYGRAMDSRHLPGSWSSTANLLEALAFAAKDAVLVVDDFAPAGASGDVQRLHRDADRLLRALGNASGRGRMRADTTLRLSKPPRGLILSTGEDVPRGQSLRARILVLDVGPGDVDSASLTRCQADAAGGRYAAAMAGYLRWIAPRYADVGEELRSEIVRIRAAAQDSLAHRRTPEIVANLMIGIEWLLGFAAAVGAVDDIEREALRERCWRAIGRAAASQREHQAASDPATRFLELLASAIASGRGHITNIDGETPSNPAAWGWQRIELAGAFERDTWRPGHERVGWLDEAADALYLDPDASYALAQSMGRDTGDPLVVLPTTLHKRLHQAGYLASTDEARGRLTVRRQLADRRRNVLHLDPHTLEEPAQPAPAGGVHARGGPEPGADSSVVGSRVARTPAPPPAPSKSRTQIPGLVGPKGPVLEARDDAANHEPVVESVAPPRPTGVAQEPIAWPEGSHTDEPPSLDWGVIG